MGGAKSVDAENCDPPVGRSVRAAASRGNEQLFAVNRDERHPGGLDLSESLVVLGSNQPNKLSPLPQMPFLAREFAAHTSLLLLTAIDLNQYPT